MRPHDLHAHPSPVGARHAAPARSDGPYCVVRRTAMLPFDSRPRLIVSRAAVAGEVETVGVPVVEVSSRRSGVNPSQGAAQRFPGQLTIAEDLGQEARADRLTAVNRHHG